MNSKNNDSLSHLSRTKKPGAHGCLRAIRLLRCSRKVKLSDGHHIITWVAVVVPAL